VTTRDATVPGTPCWADLWTSDVEGSRRFYAEVVGWTALEPNPQFGGYFNFERDGSWIAGGMGDMGDMKADNTWKAYLATDDMAKTLATAEQAGAHVVVPGMAVADLGVQGVIVDPTGASIGLWQAGTWPGFSVVEEAGAASWFELHTRDYASAIDFYRTLFDYEIVTVSDSEQFRYSTLRLAGSDADIAGICDDSGNLPEGATPYWAIYWDVPDVDAAASKAEELGAKVTMAPATTPYGRISWLVDPAGATFALRNTTA
jgi:predicted enzyme related to lactoylglutathione lyase